MSNEIKKSKSPKGSFRLLGTFTIGVILIVLANILPNLLVGVDGVSLKAGVVLTLDGWVTQTILELGKACVATYIFYRVVLRTVLHSRTHDWEDSTWHYFMWQLVLMVSLAIVFASTLMAV